MGRYRGIAGFSWRFAEGFCIVPDAKREREIYIYIYLNQPEPIVCRVPIDSIYGFILGTYKIAGSGWFRYMYIYIYILGVQRPLTRVLRVLWLI